MTTATVHADVSLRRSSLEELVDLAGLVATWCDRAEHNEGADRAELLCLGRRTRALGLLLLLEAGLDPLPAYAARLRDLEARNVLLDEAATDVASHLLAAKTWRQAQLVQAEHDRAFHPDVIGLPKVRQLQHYALHLAKLARHLQLAARSDENWRSWTAGRVADVLVFGVKLATVTNHRLPDEPLDAAPVLSEAAPRSATR